MNVSDGGDAFLMILQFMGLSGNVANLYIAANALIGQGRCTFDYGTIHGSVPIQKHIFTSISTHSLLVRRIETLTRHYIKQVSNHKEN